MDTTLDNHTEYAGLLQTQEWLMKRQKILRRDDYKCFRCGSADGLEVHHRQYHKKSATGQFVNPWDYKENNLITLCQKCHKLGHQKFTVPVFYI